MSNLELKFKLTRISLVLSVLFIVVSCRKKMDIEPGTFSSLDAKGWVKITPSYCQQLYALEIFNNELYIGGEFEDQFGYVENFAKLKEDLSLQSAANGFFTYGGVHDIHVYNNDLYLGGNFMFSPFNQGSTQTSLMYCDENGFTSSIPFCQIIPAEVYHLNEFNGDLIIAGFFLPSISAYITTKNIERFSGSSCFGMADFNSTVRATTIYNNEYYAAGDNGSLSYWNGSSWSTIIYDGQSNGDQLIDLAVKNGKLYILGNFVDGSVIKTFDINTGNWANIDSISKNENINSHSCLKNIGNTMYLCSNDILLNGIHTSNLLESSDGVSWKNVGEIGVELRDVVLFNNSIYVASNKGLFRYND